MVEHRMDMRGAMLYYGVVRVKVKGIFKQWVIQFACGGIFDLMERCIFDIMV